MALPTGLGQRALQSLNRPSALQFIGAPQIGAPATQPVPQNIMGLRQKVLEQQMRPQMTPAQQFRQLAGMSAAERLGQQRPSVPPKAPTGMQGLLSGLMPEAGTPEMAGYGAAGQKLLELSGYRAVPITIGEALGQAAGAYGEARGAALQQQQEAQLLKAEQARQAKADEMAAERHMLEMDKLRREATSPEVFSAAGEYAMDLGYKPNTPEFRAAMREYIAKAKSGTEVSVTLQDGEAMPLDKANIKTVQMDIIKGSRTEDMLADIEATFRPEFQEIPTRISLQWSEIKSKLGRGLPEDEAQLLRDYSEYQQNAIYAINQYIRDITGAQMSVAEAQRLALALPQVGTGVFDGDSPERFKSKLDNAIRQVRRAQERANYFLRRGLEPTFDYKEREFSSEEGIAPELAGTRFDTDVTYKVYGRTIDVRSEADMNWLKTKELENISKKYETEEYAELSDDEKVTRILQERDALFS